MNTDKCQCGSGKPFSECCEYYFKKIGLRNPTKAPESLIISWKDTYAPPILSSFEEKTKTYIFRISHYLDDIFDQYFKLAFKPEKIESEEKQEEFFHIKHNILLSILGAFSCLSQGFFLQSGALFRTACEDCIVLIDLYENNKQLEKFFQKKYSTTGLLSRTKRILPKDVISWYTYFSANFTHFGPLHPAPYMPRACYPDNWILVTGLQNLVRVLVTLHIILERVHFEQVSKHLFWRQESENSNIIFNEESEVFEWSDKLGKEVVIKYPPNEKKKGFTYTGKTYKTK